ncbi:MAG: aspartate/glutamate racemase family protein [Christensenellales bacterium]|jgi:Asp/Glu/hydantoin racemase
MSKQICVLQTNYQKSNKDFDDEFARLCPGVRIAYVADSTLLADVRASGGPTNEVIARMGLYAMAAEKMGADVILNSCSSVGEVADIYSKLVGIPVVKIDQAMAEEAVSLGENVVLVATVESTLGPSRRLIEQEGRRQGKTMNVTEYLVEGAYNILQSGDRERHNRMVLDAIGSHDGKCDAIVMAQVSMRALLPQLGDTKTPVLCSFYSGLKRAAETVLAL